MTSKATQPKLPEVRQDTDSASPTFGHIATAGVERMAGLWFVGNGAHGGGWESEDHVKDWAVGTFPVTEPKEQPAE